METDRDVHVVIADVGDPSQTMIVEFPNADTCDGAIDSIDSAQMKDARQSLEAVYGAPPTSHFETLSGNASFVGVGFFDFQHGQTGVAPNAIELHPVLAFVPLPPASENPSAVATATPEAPTPTLVPALPPTLPPPPPPPPPPVPPRPCATSTPANPWGYDFCTPGVLIYSPPASICSYIACIANFWNGSGYVIECSDGTFSKSGGIRGSCSHHGGNLQPLYAH